LAGDPTTAAGRSANAAKAAELSAEEEITSPVTLNGKALVAVAEATTVGL
jgi:hypothetical protein